MKLDIDNVANKYLNISPDAISTECSQEHIKNVIEDAKSTILSLCEEINRLQYYSKANEIYE